jgi:hypothetical protein
MTLVVLGVRDGKVAPDLAAALQDRAPERRAAAALVLGRSGTAEQRGGVRALLNDADARVRFRAAQGLLAGHDREAIPTLIALLADGPLELAEQAQDLLGCAAAEQVKLTPLGSSAVSRKLCRGAWEFWWKSYGPAVPLAARDVDVPLFNPALQARTAVRQFFTALRQGDLALFEKVTDVPFVVSGGQTFATREQLDQLCLNVTPAGGPMPFVLGRVFSVDAYLQRLPADQRAPFQPLRKPENRAVSVYGSFLGRWNRSAAIVRLAGGRARVVGVVQEPGSGPPSR